jgi:hypothetical protein
VLRDYFSGLSFEIEVVPWEPCGADTPMDELGFLRTVEWTDPMKRWRLEQHQPRTVLRSSFKFSHCQYRSSILTSLRLRAGPGSPSKKRKRPRLRLELGRSFEQPSSEGYSQATEQYSAVSDSTTGKIARQVTIGLSYSRSCSRFDSWRQIVISPTVKPRWPWSGN